MQGTAAGNINTSRFLTRTTSADAEYTQATGTSVPLAGISSQSPRNNPYIDDGNAYAAIAGENIRVYEMTSDMEAPLQLGGTVAAGDLLTSDGSGQGVTATTGQQYGAQALMKGVSGQTITVKPIQGTM
jgi:hypothetical protein